jgi:hypothetical protein
MAKTSCNKGNKGNRLRQYERSEKGREPGREGGKADTRADKAGQKRKVRGR